MRVTAEWVFAAACCGGAARAGLPKLLQSYATVLAQWSLEQTMSTAVTASMHA